MTKIITLNLGLSNSFLIKQDGLILVDTGINVSTEIFVKIFKENSINPQEIKLIIITHGHTDHFAHISQLKKMTGARVLCHKNALHAIKTGISSEVIPRNLLGRLLKQIFKGKIKDGYIPEIPDITIDSPYDLKEFGVSGKIIPTPGHTDCSVSIILDSGQAIIGDIMLSLPCLPNTPFLAFFANDTKQLLDSIHTLINNDVTIFYAAHGGPYLRDQVIKLVSKFNNQISSDIR